MSAPQKRNTWQKEAVRQALSEATTFVSASELHSSLETRGSKVGLATVYRALAELQEAGDADTITSNDGQALYRACGKEHHHHLVCRNCGLAVEIDAAEVEAWANKVAKLNDFADPRHTIELFGICRNCQGAGS